MPLFRGDPVLNTQNVNTVDGNTVAACTYTKERPAVGARKRLVDQDAVATDWFEDIEPMDQIWQSCTQFRETRHTHLFAAQFRGCNSAAIVVDKILCNQSTYIRQRRFAINAAIELQGRV